MIDQRFSGIYTCWEIFWVLDWNIVLDKGLVSVASPLGFDRGVVSKELDKTVESISPSYKIAY